MKKIQVMLDDTFAQSIKASAQQAGLSTSSYARLLLKDAYKKMLSPLEKSLVESEGDITSSGDAFLKELDEMIKRA